MTLAQAVLAEERLDGGEAKAYNSGYQDALREVAEFIQDQEDE
jgi:hypothetical protein